MNDDELRAFLESATVGGDDEEQDSHPHTEPELTAPEPPASASRVAADSVNADPAPPTAPLPVTPAPMGAPSAPAASGAPAAPANPIAPRMAVPPVVSSAAAPSFDELVSGVAPASAQPVQPVQPAQPTPIVLPGPPSAPREPGAAAATRPTSFSTPTPSVAAPTVPVTTTSGSAAAAPTASAATAMTAATTATAASARTPSAAAPTPPAVPAAAAAAPPTAQMPKIDDYEKISVTGGERNRSRALPWIIVGAGAAVAIIASLFIVNAMRGGSEPTPTTAPTTTSTQTTGSGTQTSSPTSPTTTSKPTTTSPNKVPVVDVGPTMNMPVTQWNIQVDLSQRLGQTYYNLEGDKLLLSTALIDSLPASCAKQPWGMTKLAGGKFEVLKPAERCAAAPELYDELWGLMDAMVKTARPL